MLIKMEEEALAAKAASALLSYFFGGYTNNTYSTVGTDVSGGNIQFISHVSRSANGNVFSGPGIAAYENQIVSKPTRFYANGGNVMGEAGPEAIMPLTRGPGGKLGVQASGGSGGVVVNQTITVNNNGQTQSNTQTQGQNIDAIRAFNKRMKDVAQQTILAEQRPGGSLWRMAHA